MAAGRSSRQWLDNDTTKFEQLRKGLREEKELKNAGDHLQALKAVLVKTSTPKYPGFAASFGPIWIILQVAISRFMDEPIVSKELVSTTFFSVGYSLFGESVLAKFRKDYDALNELLQEATMRIAQLKNLKPAALSNAVITRYLQNGSQELYNQAAISIKTADQRGDVDAGIDTIDTSLRKDPTCTLRPPTSYIKTKMAGIGAAGFAVACAAGLVSAPVTAAVIVGAMTTGYVGDRADGLFEHRHRRSKILALKALAIKQQDQLEADTATASRPSPAIRRVVVAGR